MNVYHGCLSMEPALQTHIADWYMFAYDCAVLCERYNKLSDKCMLDYVYESCIKYSCIVKKSIMYFVYESCSK